MVPSEGEKEETRKGGRGKELQCLWFVWSLSAWTSAIASFDFITKHIHRNFKRLLSSILRDCW